ncbi:MAG: dehydrogenase [Candidatus Heimdallarchaeota archaeon]|nr:dehydrogenase [Candidatus Heimdallarchaeota archaeon]
MREPGEFKTGQLSDSRLLLKEFTEQSKYYNHIFGLVELDVTKGREYIRKHQEKTGEKLSFTAWIMKCIAQAITEFPELQTFTRGRNSRKTITFFDVDIKCLIEKEIKGKKIPIFHIIRKANEKSFLEIHEEIRQAQKYDRDQRKKEQKIKQQRKRLVKLPRFLRKIFWKRVMTDPFRMKKHYGTIGLTSMGMFGKAVQSGWAIPKTAHTTTFALGAVSKKPVVNEKNEIIIREFLCTTIIVNHDTVDGGPAARFVARLNELTKSGFGLSEK